MTIVPITAIGWSSQLACPVWADPDYVLSLHHVRGTFGIKNFTYSFHRGPIWVSLPAHTPSSSKVNRLTRLLVNIDVRLPHHDGVCKRRRFSHSCQSEYRVLPSTRCCAP